MDEFLESGEGLERAHNSMPETSSTGSEPIRTEVSKAQASSEGEKGTGPQDLVNKPSLKPDLDVKNSQGLFDITSSEGFAIFKIPLGETRARSLPNQKVGEQFEIPIEELENASSVEVGSLPNGLVFDESQKSIKGIPKDPGQFKVQFLVRFQDKAALGLEFDLIVVPDPKTLWKTIATDKNAPFWKPDRAVDIESTANFFAIAASNRGRSHAHEGKFREDDFSMLCLGRDAWNVFCVADGAGSASLARRGSQIASSVATKKLAPLLETHLTPLLKHYKKSIREIGSDPEVTNALYRSLIAASFDAASALKEEAKVHEKPVKDFNTTLLLVATKKFDIGHVVVGFNIGDGASAVIYDDGEGLSLMCEPESGEFAGQTKFLSVDEFTIENNQLARLKITVLDSFDAIVVMSDGVSDAKFPNDNALGQPSYWRNLIFDDWAPAVLPNVDIKSQHFPAPTSELKTRANDWLDYWAPGTHDDRTLIVALPKEGH